MSNTLTSYLYKSFRFHGGVLLDDIKNARDKDYFRPHGVSVFVGRQGSGKTLSAVKLVDNLMKRYPKAKLVTNIIFNRDLIDYSDRITEFQDIDQLANLLVSTNNSKYGVIYLIDEIHTYFNSLESKNIPPHIFTEIAQQRKQKKLIIGTSQLWDRMAKPFREQAELEIRCNTIFGILTTQTIIDAWTLEMNNKTGRSEGQIVKRAWFFQDRRLRSLYDTYQKVVFSSVQMEFETSNKFLYKAVKK